MREPITREQLPEDSKIWLGEHHPGCVRVIVFGIDHETKAMHVDEIAEATTFPMAVDTILAQGINGIAADNAWTAIEHEDGSVRYLQPDEISLSEAIEAAVGIPLSRNAPPPGEWQLISESPPNDDDGSGNADRDGYEYMVRTYRRKKG